MVSSNFFKMFQALYMFEGCLLLMDKYVSFRSSDTLREAHRYVSQSIDLGRTG
jgi:hypothetical protein